jgi:hypothetical protein
MAMQHGFFSCGAFACDIWFLNVEVMSDEINRESICGSGPRGRAVSRQSSDADKKHRWNALQMHVPSG